MSKKCQHFYDIDSPEVVSGEREKPGYCEKPVYKGKSYCIDHCAEHNVLSQKDAVAYELSKDNKRGKVASGVKKMLDIFSDEFDAEYTYKYVKMLGVAKPGEDNLEMYVYASWKYADRETRSPETEVKLAEILGVPASRFREWDETPELAIMMNNMLEKLVDVVGKTRFWKGAITRLDDDDKMTRNKAWEFLGKRYAKSDGEPEREIRLQLPDSALPVLEALVKHLTRMDPEGDDGKAVKAGVVMRELSGGSLDD